MSLQTLGSMLAGSTLRAWVVLLVWTGTNSPNPRGILESVLSRWGACPVSAHTGGWGFWVNSAGWATDGQEPGLASRIWWAHRIVRERLRVFAGAPEGRGVGSRGRWEQRQPAITRCGPINGVGKGPWRISREGGSWV